MGGMSASPKSYLKQTELLHLMALVARNHRSAFPRLRCQQAH
jgi:hypothetical protein